jgi:hypothetical protein
MALIHVIGAEFLVNVDLQECGRLGLPTEWTRYQNGTAAPHQTHTALPANPMGTLGKFLPGFGFFLGTTNRAIKHYIYYNHKYGIL